MPTFTDRDKLDISIDGDRVEMMLIAPLSDLQTEAAGGPEALADRDDLFRFEGVTCDFEASAVTSADVFEDMWPRQTFLIQTSCSKTVTRLSQLMRPFCPTMRMIRSMI